MRSAWFNGVLFKPFSISHGAVIGDGMVPVDDDDPDAEYWRESAGPDPESVQDEDEDDNDEEVRQFAEGRFTGTITDSLGRKRTYVDGKQVAATRSPSGPDLLK